MKKKLIALMGSVVCVLLVINTYLILSGHELQLTTFAGFFQTLADLDSIDASFIGNAVIENLKITADWGNALNVLRDFINGLSEILGVAAYSGTLIINIVYYVYQLVRIAFVGVI